MHGQPIKCMIGTQSARTNWMKAVKHCPVAQTWRSCLVVCKILFWSWLPDQSNPQLLLQCAPVDIRSRYSKHCHTTAERLDSVWAQHLEGRPCRASSMSLSMICSQVDPDGRVVVLAQCGAGSEEGIRTSKACRLLRAVWLSTAPAFQKKIQMFENAHTAGVCQFKSDDRP